MNNGACYLSAFEDKQEIGVRYMKDVSAFAGNGFDDCNSDTFNCHVIVMV